VGAAVVALVVTVPARAGTREADREALKRVLADLLERPTFKTARVSFELRSLDTGERIFAHGSDELLNPASNVKLVTAAAALWKLGPEYRFETEFLTDPDFQPTSPQARAKVLYVRGKGDPSITNERLYGMVSELVHTGLREVGDIVIDESWFDAERMAPGFDQDRSDRSYNAPTGAVSINWNSVGVYVRAGEGPGKKAVVEVEPHSDFFVVDNGLHTGSRRYRRFTISSEPAGEKQRIVVRGVVPSDQTAVATYKKIDNPPWYFGHTLRQMLVMRGVKVRGRVRVGVTPDKARLLSVAVSETFDLILKRMNKHSSNFVAEMLIKTLGAEVGGRPGTFAKGLDVVEDFLEKQVGIPRGTYVMKNGSGINDTNRFSAAQMNKILQFMYQNGSLSPEYLSALGIAGKDGTLRYRFEGSDAVGRLRAKTGTLSNVTALAGYVQAVGGEKFIFAVMVNDFPGRAGPVIESVDALGAAVAAAGSSSGPGQAVVALAGHQTAIAPVEEAKTRIKTYLALGQQKDRRNVFFLRTVWRSEKDPAVRAVVAESVYRSDPEDAQGVRALLDSISGADDVYGRLRQLAKEMAIDVPAVPAVVEVAAQGNAEAMARLVELARPSEGDPAAEREVAAAMSEVARTAPEELIGALRGAPTADRESAIRLLARGLVKVADAEHPFWPALKRSMGSVEPAAAAFAREMDATLSLRIAEEKAPRPPPADTAATAPPAGPSVTAETRPGG
jgi:D-alanyl-D-alanine carboxypeptidase/D-alanyl-D-alanine-endopeptidase (penicillin-binding protein 4)